MLKTLMLRGISIFFKFEFCIASEENSKLNLSILNHNEEEDNVYQDKWVLVETEGENACIMVGQDSLDEVITTSVENGSQKRVEYKTEEEFEYETEDKNEYDGTEDENEYEAKHLKEEFKYQTEHLNEDHEIEDEKSLDNDEIAKKSYLSEIRLEVPKNYNSWEYTDHDNIHHISQIFNFSNFITMINKGIDSESLRIKLAFPKDENCSVGNINDSYNDFTATEDENFISHYGSVQLTSPRMFDDGYIALMGLKSSINESILLYEKEGCSNTTSKEDRTPISRKTHPQEQVILLRFIYADNRIHELSIFYGNSIEEIKKDFFSEKNIFVKQNSFLKVSKEHNMEILKRSELIELWKNIIEIISDQKIPAIKTLKLNPGVECLVIMIPTGYTDLLIYFRVIVELIRVLKFNLIHFHSINLPLF